MQAFADYRFGIGVMSKNVVDACIDFAHSRDRCLFLIPSRRQVEWDGGYANGWTTERLADYVRSKIGSRILLMRDHAGPKQGDKQDNGFESLRHDCMHFNLIHLDPWKMAYGLRHGWSQTKRMIEYCYTYNPQIRYEIGTEQSIFPYGAAELDDFISYLQDWLSPNMFDQVVFAVIQSGTALKGNENIGVYDPKRLADMVTACAQHGLVTKAHNGDYLPQTLIDDMFDLGVNAINIAPEFGQIETQTYLTAIGDDQNLLDIFYRICHASGRWVKWLDADKPINQIELINVCGHYVISNPDFIQLVKSQLRSGIDNLVQANLIRKLDQLHGIA